MIRPGKDAPIVTEIKFAITQIVIMIGTMSGLNQEVGNLDAELRIKILPKAAIIDPKKHQYGLSTSIIVLSQTPPTTNIPPNEQPIFIPNVSKIQLAGKAKKGWRIGNTKVLRVTINLSKWNTY